MLARPMKAHRIARLRRNSRNRLATPCSVQARYCCCPTFRQISKLHAKFEAARIWRLRFASIISCHLMSTKRLRANTRDQHVLATDSGRFPPIANYPDAREA